MGPRGSERDMVRGRDRVAAEYELHGGPDRAGQVLQTRLPPVDHRLRREPRRVHLLSLLLILFIIVIIIIIIIIMIIIILIVITLLLFDYSAVISSSRWW